MKLFSTWITFRIILSFLPTFFARYIKNGKAHHTFVSDNFCNNIFRNFFFDARACVWWRNSCLSPEEKEDRKVQFTWGKIQWSWRGEGGGLPKKCLKHPIRVFTQSIAFFHNICIKAEFPQDFPRILRNVCMKWRLTAAWVDIYDQTLDTYLNGHLGVMGAIGTF